MDTYSRARRGIALGASGLLVAGATVAMTTATTTSANAGKINKNYTYRCEGIKPIHMDPMPIPIKTRVTLPNAAKAGQKVGKRTARLRLSMPDSLRDTVTGLLQATEAKGGSDDAAVGLRIGKRKRSVKLKNLNAPRAEIPTDKPWVINTTGKLNAFRIPANARGGSKARLSMPKSFTVDATLYTADGTPTEAVLECKAPKKRALGTINIRKAPSKLGVNVKPKRVIAKKTRAKVHVKVKSTGKATGKVRVKQGNKVLGTANLKKEKAVVTLKRFAKPGKRRLTITYAGNKSVKASTAKRTVRVRK